MKVKGVWPLLPTHCLWTGLDRGMCGPYAAQRGGGGGEIQAPSPPALRCGAQAPWEGESLLEFLCLYGLRSCPTTQMGCVG